MADIIRVPTGSRIGGAMRSYAVGAIGGAVNNVASAVTGNGLIGSAISTIVAGSILPETEGKIIAVMNGYVAGQQLSGGLISSLVGGQPSGPGVM